MEKRKKIRAAVVLSALVLYAILILSYLSWDTGFLVVFFPALALPIILLLLLWLGGGFRAMGRLGTAVVAVAGAVGVLIALFLVESWVIYRGGLDPTALKQLDDARTILLFFVFPAVGFLGGVSMLLWFAVGVFRKGGGRPDGMAPARPLVCGLLLIACAAVPALYLIPVDTTGATHKETEARVILTGIYEAEMAYFSTTNTFSADPEIIGFETAAPPKYYQWEIISADDEHFLARVWGNIDDDPDLDIWEETERMREPYRVFDDTTDEGTPIDPRDPKRYAPDQ